MSRLALDVYNCNANSMDAYLEKLGQLPEQRVNVRTLIGFNTKEHTARPRPDAIGCIVFSTDGRAFDCYLECELIFAETQKPKLKYLSKYYEKKLEKKL